MKHLAPLILLLFAFAGTVPSAPSADPSIVGTPQTSDADNTIRVKVGQIPWISLAVKDAPAGAVQSWTGPIGEGKIGFYTKDGVGVAIVIPGTFQFRCRLQTPKEGLDEIVDVETTLVVEGSGPAPTPTPTPVVEDFPTKLAAAVKANPEAKLAQVANTYVTVADGIKGGVFTTPQQVTAATDGFVGLIGSTAWPGIKSSVVDPYLATQALTKAGDYEPLWRQIAAAVKAGLTDIPPPDPDVDPPIPVTGLHVLILEETGDRNKLKPGQLAILTSTVLRQWFTDNNADWRIWDKDVDAQFEPQVWKDALKLERGPLPWIIVANGKTGYSGPLPQTVEETILLLNKYKP